MVIGGFLVLQFGEKFFLFRHFRGIQPEREPELGGGIIRAEKIGRAVQDLLRGVGAVADLTSSVQGSVEIVWKGTTVFPAIKALNATCYTTGDTVRAVLPETNQDAAIDAIRRERARLVSVTPVRASLEDYFVAQLAAPADAMT